MAKKTGSTTRTVRPAAVALRYRQNQDTAPKVLAKGKSLMAERILQKAVEHHIPIVENADLLNLLMNLEVQDPIPSEAFEAVAAIYAFLMEVDEKYAQVLA